MTAVHVIAAAADAAFDRYEEASARAARYLTGAQLELFDTASAEAAEWRDIWLACDREVRL